MILMVRRIFQILVSSARVRYGVLPTSADGAAAAAITLAAAAVAWTWGAYVQIAASVGAADVQIVGVTLENFVGAASQGEIQIASGAALAEVVLVTVPAVGAVYTFDTPILVNAGVRVAARYRTSTGAADTVDAKLLIKTGF